MEQPTVIVEQPSKVVPFRRAEAKRRRVSVATILALTFGLLVMVSIGAVLALTVGANYRNTFDLVGQRAALMIEGMEGSLKAHMKRAEDAVVGIASLYEAGGFEIDDAGAMTGALSGALAAVPDAEGMLIFDRDLNYRGVVRGKPSADGSPAIQVFPKQPVTSPEIRHRLEQMAGGQGLLWGDFVLEDGMIFANVGTPLVRQGNVAGWVVAPIELITLSKITSDLSGRFETTAFIIDGDDNILAHPHLLAPRPKKWADQPTIPLAQFDDPVLANYANRIPTRDFTAANMAGVQIAEIDAGGGADGSVGRNYIVITKQIDGYGPRPWTLGAYFTKAQLGDEIVRVWISAAIGLALLVVAVIMAILLGKHLSKPIKEIAAQAHLVADLELDGVKPLPRSRVLEFDNQAAAFNAMLTGLRAFSAYVPRSLVAKLVRTGDADATRPREATVTVMFTDIANFTSLAEHLPANDGAEMLNHHFELVCGAISAEGGTVDKFLGDGVMAFFGAPDRLKGHGAAAVRAAIAIREALEADNKTAAERGWPPLSVRMGIHTGKAIVGNIGASDRVNYTIVGDTVNVSQRLQGLGKLLAPDAETTIVISGETASRLDERIPLKASGKHRLRGRGEPIEVFVVGEVDLDAVARRPQKIAQDG